MTIEEALKTDRQLILTVQSPEDGSVFTVTMVQPYSFLRGYLYGRLKGNPDGDWMVHEDFIWGVKLGDPIEESMK